MATLEEESLFSLELVVDKLTIPKVPCRFPAVAFRLLDFPTLIIYHVEPELGDTIKAKIRSDPYIKVEGQIPELLDREGSYSIKKGKSCLLRISPDMLLSHLLSTPLYVMVIDTYPEVPKLVGNCTVPLDSTMDKLYDNICKDGLAVPVVQGEKGVYKVYNLMGTEIGGVVLGIRLLSLGVGLIPHLPAASATKLKKPDAVHKQVPSKLEKNRIQEQIAEIVLEDLEEPKGIASISAARQVEKPSISKFQIQTQTEEDVQNIATQTELKKSKKKKQMKSGMDIRVELHDTVTDDIIVTNTVCPPPMFFNSDMEATDHAVGLKFYNNLMESHEEWIDISDDDTIRLEDKLSDSELESESKAAKITSAWEQPKKEFTYKQFNKPHDRTAPNIKGFPLLNALMAEIVSLQNGTTKDSSHEMHISAPSKFLQQRSRSVSPVQSKHVPSLSRSPSPGRERQSVEKYLHRMSTPRQTVRELPSPKSARKPLPEPKRPLKMHKCQAAPKGVPKNKSWIRKVPPSLGVTKTKLAYGLTNTQKLRLERSNPELLATLQKEEEDRLKRWKEKRQLADEQKLTGSFDDISWTIHGHAVHKQNIGQASGESKRNKRPIPTPRQHSHQELALGESQESFSGVPVAPTPRNHYIQQEKDNILKLRNEPDEGSFEDSYASSKSQNSVQMYAPESRSVVEYEESDIEGNFHSGMHETRNTRDNNPGFLPSDMEDTQDPSYANNFESAKPTQRTDIDSYSNNFAGTDAGEALGLRKMVDAYTDDESRLSEQSFKSARSQHSDKIEFGKTPYAQRGTSTFKVTLPENVKSPKASSSAPMVTNLKHGNRGLMANSAATVEASVESTAYISRSQVLSQQSYESNISNESYGNTKQEQKRPQPRQRHNTESVSSYNGEDISPRSGVSHILPESEQPGYESESFEEDSDFNIPEPQSVDNAKVVPEARFGYTWGL